MDGSQHHLMPPYIVGDITRGATNPCLAWQYFSLQYFICVHAHSSGATFAELSGALEQFSLDIFTPLIGGNKLFHTYGIEANSRLFAAKSGITVYTRDGKPHFHLCLRFQCLTPQLHDCHSDAVVVPSML